MKIELSKAENGTETVLEIENSTGMSLVLSTLGAGIKSVKVPDYAGVSREVTRLSEGGYAENYHGKTIGRTAGRICGATFTIGNRTAVLEKNNHGEDNLHGGSTGLHAVNFIYGIMQDESFTDIVFSYTSPDGEGGYFGTVKIKITYRVYENENKLRLIFAGEPDSETLLNLTNHVYWNVSGDLRENVKGQYVYLNCPEYGVLNERLIVEKIAPVGKAFDFRTPRKMGEYLDTDTVQRFTKGYDHPFFNADGVACSLKSDLSKIKLAVSSSYPCVVMYGDNHGGYNSVCFECQYHPDGIHQTPDRCGICTPQSPYGEYMEYTFTVEE